MLLRYLNACLISLILILVNVNCSTSYKYSFEEENMPLYEGDFRLDSDERNLDQISIKVVSFNIEFANNIEGAIELFQSEALKDCDVLLLQEMDEKGTERIAKGLGMTYIYYPAIYHPKHEKMVGNAILSRWDITKCAKVKLPHPSSYVAVNRTKKYKFRKTATVAEIDFCGQFISLASTHAAAFNTTEKRRQYARALADHMGNENIHKAIIGGDFNSLGFVDIEATVSPFEDNGFQWASKDIGMTVAEKKSILKVVPSSAFQLDHIFVKNVEVVDCGKINQAGVSDHLPIWVIVSIR